MGLINLISGLFEKRATKKTGGNPQSPSYWVQKMFGATENTAAGIHVDEQTALTSTAVWRAVSLVSQTIGALPLHLYEQEGERTKSKATAHQLYRLMHDEPNPEQTAMEFREMMQAHALTWGRAHAEIVTDRRGKVQLWPLIPDRVEAMRAEEKGSLVYRIYLPEGGHKILLSDEVFTLRGLGHGINTSYNVVQLFRESIGLTLAVDEFGARFFGNGATMGGALEHPGTLGEEEYKQLRTSMNERHQGLTNAHRLLILEEGMKYKEIAVPNDKAQYLETRKFQINDVARIIGVPPHKLAEMTQATFSNIEHQSIEYIQDTIGPWCVRWEQGLKRQLLTDAEKQRYFFKHNLAGLQRGDFKTRMEGYSIGRQNGWLSANDIREMEDMNPIDNGDMYLVPLNMIPADQAANPKEPENDARYAYKPLIRNAITEIVKRERADIIREAEKLNKKGDFSGFEQYLNRFYDEHREYISRKMTPVLESYAGATGADMAEYLESFTARHILSALTQIRAAIQAENPISALESEFESWEECIDAMTAKETALLPERRKASGIRTQANS